MNIYISHSGYYNYEDELYQPIRDSALYKEHTFFLPHEPKNLDASGEEVLKQTDVLVAEVSYPSTGQGIELGWANVAGVPVLCFYKQGYTPSSSLRFVTNKLMQYKDSNELLKKLQAQLVIIRTPR